MFVIPDQMLHSDFGQIPMPVIGDRAGKRQPLPPTDKDYPIMVRIEGAVQLTGIGRTRLYELIGSGAIESVKIGRSRHIIVASLIRFVGDLPRE